VATAYDDRSKAEWPPHPARVFSSLAATLFAEFPPRPGEREALRWLEQLGPPEIQASGASQRDVCTFFVPVNDGTVVGDFEDGIAEVEAVRAALPETPREALKHAKAVEKAETKLREQIARAIQPGKVSAE